MTHLHAPGAMRGATLIVALLFLALLSVIGVVAMRSASLEEKMTGNSYDKTLAFEAAEAALRDAESDIFKNLNASSAFRTDCQSGLCLPAIAAAPQWKNVDWNGATTRIYGSGSAVGNYPGSVARPPRYIVELLPDMPPPTGNSMSLNSSSSSKGGTPFRITAIGWGRRDTTRVQLQSVFIKEE